MMGNKWGGKRPGAGRPPTDNPRTVKKQLRWTPDEWEQVEQGAADAGMSVADFQRKLILKWR